MNIGIIRIDRMGDMILTLPIIKSLKINNSSIEIDVFASTKNIKIIENFQYIDRIINVDKSNNSKKKYDLILNFSPGWKSFFLCLFSNSKIKANIIFTSRYKNKLYSKILIYFLSKIFFQHTLIVNRIKRYNSNKSIHQTDMMFKLINQCKISYNEDIEIEKYLPNKINIKSKKRICLLHLSSRWINKYYSEIDFLKLINLIEKKFSLILTSDTTTKQKFSLIYDKYKIINNDDFKKIKETQNITILENLNFENWIQSIYSADLVITPECGCSHIATLCKINSKIIYDSDNMPNMINAEYAPWKGKYEKYFFNSENLNNLLTKNL